MPCLPYPALQTFRSISKIGAHNTMIVLVHQRLASKWYGPKCRGTDAVVPKDDCAREALRYCTSRAW